MKKRPENQNNDIFRGSGTGKLENTMIRRRITVVTIIILLAFIPLILQLFRLMIIEHEDLELQAVDQQTRVTEISPTRGNITDRNGETLAMSASVETVFISPAEIESDEDGEIIAKGLSELLDVDYDTIKEMETHTESYYKVVKKKISQDLAKEVEEFIEENDNIRGIYMEDDYLRYYPHDNLASTVLGFVTSDNRGAEGLEAYYNTSLQGTAGRVTTTKSAYGRDTPETSSNTYEAEDGNNITLTIDAEVQAIIEENLEQAVNQYKVSERATCIVMNVKTGAILGMAVKGDYNPNEPRTITDETVLAQLESDELTDDEKNELLVNAQYAQWRNKCVSDTYEPGSTFKIITAAAALEEGVVTPTDSFYCSGSLMVAGWDEPIACWLESGHKAETFLEGFENSCNVVFMTIGQRLGTEKFYEYMEAFGLLDKTGIDLPGEANSITLDYEDFSQNVVSLSSYSFGQTFTVTPIQLITAVCAACNDGVLMKPYIVDKITDSNGNLVSQTEPTEVRQVISEETSEIICEFLEKEVEEGTGKNAYVAGYRVGGKTGTGEKINIAADERDGNYVVSFIGVAPCDDPQYAVLLTLDHPTTGTYGERSGGIMAAPYVGSIFSDILPYLGVQPVYTAEEAKNVSVYVPSMVGESLDEAVEDLAELGLSYKVEGDGDIVTDQAPEADTKVPASSQITIYCDEEKPEDSVTVPDLEGYTVTEANKALNRLGLIMKATGATTSNYATVFTQSIDPGTQVDVGTVITVQFLE